MLAPAFTISCQWPSQRKKTSSCTLLGNLSPADALARHTHTNDVNEILGMAWVGLHLVRVS